MLGRSASGAAPALLVNEIGERLRFAWNEAPSNEECKHSPDQLSTAGLHNN
jgi:hypothetical protein